MTERKMATVRRIDAINLIEGADAIEVATVGGWKVVVKKGEYTTGQLAVYCEIDSFIPHTIAPFLTKAGQFPKVYNDVEGQRLRTIKLRGQISQGLLLPLSVVAEIFVGSKFDEGQEYSEVVYEGADVSDTLAVQKWEPPQEFRAANAKGSFPHFIQKTDQERIQNLTRSLEQWNNEKHVWQVTEKVDGSSMTVFIKDGEVGVCSRNLELKDDGSTTFWETAKSEGLIDTLKEASVETGANIALQGELIGGSIQGNAYKRDKFEFYLYDIFDIDTQTYLMPETVERFAKAHGIKHVPVLDNVITDNQTIDELLKCAEGKSVIGVKPEREGIVFKSLSVPNVSFKVISNRWLLKNEG